MPADKNKKVKSMADKLVDRFPAIVPRFLAKLIVLKILYDLVAEGFMRKETSRTIKNPSGYVPTSVRGLTPIVPTEKQDQDKSTVVGGVSADAITLHRLMDIAFPADKPPARSNVSAFVGLARRNGISEEVAEAYLRDLLDDETTRKLLDKE